jgi:hypothetical protein
VSSRHSVALWRTRALLRLLAAGAGPRSGLSLVRLRLQRGGTGEGLVRVRVRSLGGLAVELRCGTSDVYAFGDAYVERFQKPPAEVAGEPMEWILELGTNVGLGLADLAYRYPRARLLGVEADPGNAALANRNIAAFADRCEVVPAAVWDSDCELTLEGQKACGMEVRERRPSDPEDSPAIPAFAVETLLAPWRPDGEIDYVLLSAEHSEQRVLNSNNAWLRRVRSIRVETYDDIPYGAADTVRDLERLGFRAWHEPNRSGGSAVGVRKPR